jgi:hypothetical protein
MIADFKVFDVGIQKALNIKKLVLVIELENQ